MGGCCYACAVSPTQCFGFTLHGWKHRYCRSQSQSAWWGVNVCIRMRHERETSGTFQHFRYFTKCSLMSCECVYSICNFVCLGWRLLDALKVQGVTTCVTHFCKCLSCWAGNAPTSFSVKQTLIMSVREIVHMCCVECVCLCVCAHAVCTFVRGRNEALGPSMCQQQACNQCEPALDRVV